MITQEFIDDYKFRWFYGIERASLQDQYELISEWNNILRQLQYLKEYFQEQN